MTKVKIKQLNNSSKKTTTEKNGLLMAKNRVPGEYIVTYRLDTSLEQVQSQFQEFETVIFTKIDNRMWLIRFKKDPGLKRLKQISSQEDLVKDIQPNFIYNATPKPLGRMKIRMEKKP